MGVVAVGDGSTGETMEAEMHGSIAGRRLTGCIARRWKSIDLSDSCRLLWLRDMVVPLLLLSPRVETNCAGGFGNSMGALQWLLAVGPLSDLDAWASSAYVSSQMPLDVVLSEPTSECSDLYRSIGSSCTRAGRSTTANPWLRQRR